MKKPNSVPCSLGATFDLGKFWPEGSGGWWATAAALLLVFILQMARAFLKRRAVAANLTSSRAARAAPTSLPLESPSTSISGIISDADLQNLLTNLDGKSNEREKWEEIILKKNDSVYYHAKCCKPKDLPLKYHSVTIFDKCHTELLRDFYMDSHYRKIWDKSLVEFEQLKSDEASGVEIGRLVKKFPLLTPREYVLAWKVWEGNDKTFYCFTKDCEYSLALRQKKYVRVGFYRSGWRIRKVPGTNACEVAVLHQEDAGLNVEMEKLAFSRGIWSYVCKMNSALMEYSTKNHSCSPSVASMNKLIQKVPTFMESDVEATHLELSEITSDSYVSERAKQKFPSKWIANGLLLLGGIACLTRGRSTLGTQIALACIVKKLLRHGSTSELSESVHAVSSSGESRFTAQFQPTTPFANTME